MYCIGKVCEEHNELKVTNKLNSWILRIGLTVLLGTTAYFNTGLTSGLKEVRAEATKSNKEVMAEIAKSNKEVMAEIAKINIALVRRDKVPTMYSSLTEAQIGALCIVSIDDE